MENNLMTNLLSIILICAVIILIVLVIVYLILRSKTKGTKKKKEIAKKEDIVQSKEPEYNKKSVFDFMEFDDIMDNMIEQNNGKKYVMVVECQGVNYDLM